MSMNTDSSFFKAPAPGTSQNEQPIDNLGVDELLPDDEDVSYSYDDELDDDYGHGASRDYAENVGHDYD